MARAASSKTTPFKPWPRKVVETNGDYRGESWLEDHVGENLYENQKTLPRLPIPNVQETLDRFLPTALPLARTTKEVEDLKAAVAKFPAQAAPLQDRLLKRAEEFGDSSWLQLWWNQLGYLQVRDTIVINVSYFFHLSDDPTAETPIQRAAAGIAAAGEHRRLVCSGELPAEQIGRKGREKNLCCTAHKYMFNATRIPLLEQDTVRMYDPSAYNHLIVVVKGHFFALDFCDPQTGQVYPVPVLEAALQQCHDMAADLEPLPQLGWLTSQNRDDWAKARQAIVGASSHLEEALEVVESGAFMICFDDDDDGDSLTAMAKRSLHAGGDAAAGGNRWWDKAVQLVYTKTNRLSFLGEHSMMDGMPLVPLADRLSRVSYAQALKNQQGSSDVSCNVRPIFVDALRGLSTSDTEMVEGLVSKAKEDLQELVGRHSTNVQRFRGYGADFIKTAGFSPDAFVQMAIQVATYRLWGEQAGTYEATQVRPFLHGRTETTRSVSEESAAFCEAMGLRPAIGDTKEQQQEKIALLHKAVDAHVKYIGSAAKAEGVDRHFFGLGMSVGEGEETPDLLQDPVFTRSKRWRVSTSHLTHPRFENWGFGEVFPDGVGIAYSIHKRHCNFNCVALKEQMWTEKLSDLLEETLLEMRDMVEANMEAPKSKL